MVVAPFYADSIRQQLKRLNSKPGPSAGEKGEQGVVWEVKRRGKN